MTTRRDRPTAEVAAALGVPPSTLRSWVKRQQVPARRKGRRLLFDLAEVRAVVEERGLGGKPGRRPESLDEEQRQADLEWRLSRTEIAKLQAARLRHELIPREDVEVASSETVGAFVSAIRSTARTSKEHRREIELLAEQMVASALDRVRAAMSRLSLDSPKTEGATK